MRVSSRGGTQLRSKWGDHGAALGTRNMLCWCVAPAGGAQWRGGHKGAAERPECCAPLGSLEGSCPKTREELVCFAPPTEGLGTDSNCVGAGET